MYALIHESNTMRRSEEEERLISAQIDALMGITSLSDAQIARKKIIQFPTLEKQTKVRKPYQPKRSIEEFREYLKTLDLKNVLITSEKILTKHYGIRLYLVLNINGQSIKLPGSFNTETIESNKHLFVHIFNAEIKRRYPTQELKSIRANRKTITTVPQLQRHLKTIDLPRTAIDINDIYVYKPKSYVKSIVIFHYKRTKIRYPSLVTDDRIDAIKQKLLNLINTEINSRPEARYPILPLPKSITGKRTDSEYRKYLQHIVLPVKPITIDKIRHVKKYTKSINYRIVFHIEKKAVYYNHECTKADLSLTKRKFLDLLNYEIERRYVKQTKNTNSN